MPFRTFLLERLAAWDPGLNLSDPALLREVVEPLVAHVGDELPKSDPVAILKARLSADFPDIDGTVFGDLLGGAVSALFSVLSNELRMAEARRRLDDPRVLAAEDLEDSLSTFLYTPSAGNYAGGSLRAYFSVPRTLQLTPGTALRVPPRNGSPERVYYPAQAVFVSSSQMREARDERGRYYADFAIRASDTGAAYNLAPGEAAGCQGIPGAVQVTNLVSITSGEEADTVTTAKAKIQSLLRYRAMVTPGGAQAQLPGIGVTDFVIVQGGDEAMRRDRVVGVGTVAGVPGGFVYPAPVIPDGGSARAFISLGLAYDVWVSPDTRQALGSVDVRNLEGVGIEILRGVNGRLQFFNTDPLFGGPKFRLLMNTPVFLSAQGIPEDYPDTLPDPYPVQAGDLVFWEGLFTDIPGQRAPLTVVSSGVRSDGSGGSFLVLEGDEVVHPDSDGLVAGDRWAVYRPVTLASDRATVTVPLLDNRALDRTGAEVWAGRYPALPKPGSTLPEQVNASPVPKLSNWVPDAGGLPVLAAERVQLLDAVTHRPTGDYVYPRVPLFVEFLYSKSGAASEKATRVRVHLQGPQATAFPDSLEIASSEGTTRVVPCTWTPIACTSPSDVAATDIITLATTPGPLPYTGGTLAERLPAAGDWVRFSGTFGGVPYQFELPILALEAGNVVRFHTSDLPGDLTGTAQILQGCSRATQLAAGRGPEGTWSVDVWCQESTAAGYTPGDPPLFGTQGYLDPRELLTQGFELLGASPGHYFSAAERPSLLLEGAHGCDGQAWVNRSVRIHSFPSRKVLETDALIQQDSNRGLALSGLTKLYSPTFLHVAVYYDAEALEPAQAAAAVLNALETADREDRLDLSDLVAGLTQAGADYVVTGRLFAAQQDDRRQWTSYATRGSVPVKAVGDLYLSTVVCTRLRRRARGETLDHLDPDNWTGQVVLRPGGFDAD